MRKLIVITGLSGAGKSAAAKYLNDEMNIPKVITATTRDARVGEIDGKDYYFVDDSSFALYDKVEETIYGGNRYGIVRKDLEALWNEHDIICVVTDAKGIDNLRALYGNKVISVFINASINELEKRMIARGDATDKIKERLNGKRIKEEQFNRLFCDYEIRNEFSDRFFYKELSLLIRKIQD